MELLGESECVRDYLVTYLVFCHDSYGNAIILRNGKYEVVQSSNPNEKAITVHEYEYVK